MPGLQWQRVTVTQTLNMNCVCDEEYLCLRLGVDHADDLDLDVVAVAPEPVLLDLDLGRV